MFANWISSSERKSDFSGLDGPEVNEVELLGFSTERSVTISEFKIAFQKTS